MIDNSKSEFRDEREEILDAMRENDKVAWQRLQVCNIFMPNSIHHTLMGVLEKQLERAGKLKFEGEWDEAKVARIEVYSTIYHLIGTDPETARQKAEELANAGSLGGIKAMF